MKKIIVKFLIFSTIFIMISLYINYTYAMPNQLSVSSYTSNSVLTENNELENQLNSELVEMKSKTENEIEKYEQTYGSKAYGYTAYILNKIRIFSIPLCFLGIAIGSIYQYVLGIRKMDVRDKGFALIIGFVTVLVICQVLPLIFAIVVKGWRG